MNPRSDPPDLPPTPITTLPPKLVALVDGELRPGERILWVGQPDPERHSVLLGILRIAGLGLIAVAVLPTIGLLVIAGQGAGGLRDTWPVVALGPVLGVPFLLVGGLLVAIRGLARKSARATCYVLTNDRAIILEPTWSGRHTSRSYTGIALGSMTREERDDGSGSLVFEEYLVRDTDGMGTRHPRGFLDIADVRYVEEIVRRTLVDHPA